MNQGDVEQMCLQLAGEVGKMRSTLENFGGILRVVLTNSLTYQAGALATRSALDEVLRHLGLNPQAVAANLEQRQKYYYAYLLEILEQENPALAALLDRRSLGEEVVEQPPESLFDLE